MGEFENRLKKVRKWCIIASVIVAIVFLLLAALKVSLVSGIINSGVDYVATKAELEAQNPIYGLLGIGGAVLGGLGIMFFLVKAIFFIVVIDGLIWLGYLIYYLVNKEKMKKSDNLDVKIE